MSALTKSYVQHLHGGRRQEVLQGVDLDVSAGEFVVLTGASGCGKSTLLRCIHRSALADSGTIWVRGQGFEIELVGAPDEAALRARRSVIGLASQFLQVMPRVPALELLELEGMDRTAGTDLLDQFGLPRDLHDLPPATYSGGQRQMVNLALAICRPRPLLLLDEATASLDPGHRRRALEVLLRRKEEGVAILAVFHDPPDLANLVDRVLTLADGRVVRP